MDTVNTNNGAGQGEADVAQAISENALLAAADVIAIAQEVADVIEPAFFLSVFQAAVAVFYHREFGNNLAMPLSND